MAESSRELVNFHCWLRDEHVKILVDVDEEADNASVNPKPDDSEKLQELKSELDGKWKNECETYTSVGDQNIATDLYNLVDKEILKWIIRRFLEKDLPSDEKDLTWEYAYALHKMPTWLENQDNTPEDGHDHTINSGQYGFLPYKDKIGGKAFGNQ